MDDLKANPFTREKLTLDVLNEWQNLIDSTAEIFGMPAGLITRVNGDQIEILLSSRSEGNPYKTGYTADYPNSEWFCERTLKIRDLYLIPDAHRDPQWKDNPAVAGYGMVSYMGMPIARPDGGDFGTVCFLDIKAHPHNYLHIKLLNQLKRMVELSLRVIYDKDVLDRQERLLDDLSRIYPICCHCKKVRENSGAWITVERYIRDINGKEASYGICPECLKKAKKSITR